MRDPLEPYFEAYLELVREADQAFARVKEEFGDLVRCRQGCDDCCFALFEMQAVEAAYLSCKFHGVLKRKERREILKKAEKARNRIGRLQAALHLQQVSGTQGGAMERMVALSRERVECPLHWGDRCALYPHRPITCRIYGIPTSIQGKGATCGRSGFIPGKSYPTVKLDLIDRRLYDLSKRMLAQVAGLSLPYGSLLFTVAAALQERLDHRYFQGLKP